MREIEQTTISPTSRPAGIFSGEFLHGYFITMRPYLLFVSGITGIVGLALSALTSVPMLVLLATVFFFSYGFGQALTDCTQIDTDSLSSPYRPLVQGKIKRRDVAVVSMAGLLASGLVLVLVDSIIIVPSVLAIVGLATYTYFKRRWWGGPFYNAGIVAILGLTGFMAGNGAAGVSTGISLTVITALSAVFFGYANFVLTGYYKDISADRATGYNTMPVVFGLRISAIISDLFAAAQIISAGAALYLILENPWASARIWYSVIPAAFAIFMIGLAQTRLHRVKSETGAYRAIAPVVHGYILLLAAVIVAARPGWIAAMGLFYAGFLVTMKLRPMKEQI